MTRQQPTARRETDFESVYGEWQARRIEQSGAAALLGVSVRTFRRWVHRYREEGLAGLQDKRKAQPSRRAPPEEVESLERLYWTHYRGWNVQHFYEHYVAEHGGQRSYTWVNNSLKASGLIAVTPRRNGEHSGDERSSTNRGKPSGPKTSPAIKGSLLDQCVLTDEWVPPHRWSLVATWDSFTGGVYSGFFVDRVDIWSAFRGVREVVEGYGLFDQLCENRAFFGRDSHLVTAESTQLGQFRRAMRELGIESIDQRSRRSRSRMARFARTIRDRLPKELAGAGISETNEASTFLCRYWPRFNERFAAHLDGEQETAFDPLPRHWGDVIRNVLCLKDSLRVDGEGYVQYRKRRLRIDGKRLRRDSTSKLRRHEYQDGSLALFEGTHLIGRIDAGFSFDDEE